MAKVIGLDLIALTDHSSCKNCPAFAAAAAAYGMNVLFGMELTTAEEVHVLCYFPTLNDAMALTPMYTDSFRIFPTRRPCSATS